MFWTLTSNKLPKNKTPVLGIDYHHCYCIATRVGRKWIIGADLHLLESEWKECEIEYWRSLPKKPVDTE